MTDIAPLDNADAPSPAPVSRRSRFLLAAGAVPLVLAGVVGGVWGAGTIGVQHSRDYPFRELPPNMDRVIVHSDTGEFDRHVDVADRTAPDVNRLVRPIARLSRSECTLPVGDDVQVTVSDSASDSGPPNGRSTVYLVIPALPGAPIVHCRTTLMLYLPPGVQVQWDGVSGS